MLGVARAAEPPQVTAASPAAETRKAEQRTEIIVSASRESDERLTEAVVTAIRQDAYIFSEHVIVTTTNGVVRLEGRLSDHADFLNVLRLARRIAGKRRVISRLEYVPSDDDSD